MKSSAINKVLSLLREVEIAAVFREKFDLAREAVALAEQMGPPALAHHARLTLAEAATLAGRVDLAVASFHQCLQESDADPDTFDPRRVLWQYKWIANKLCRFPSVELTGIDFALDDISARFHRVGWHPRTPVQLRMENAVRTGRVQLARDAYREWRALASDGAWKTVDENDPFNNGADCPACVRDRLVECLFFLGLTDQALCEAEPILSGEINCGEVPHLTFAQVLLPLLATERKSLADRYHSQGYLLVWGGGDFLDAISSHMLYASLTGRIEIAKTLLANHIGLTVENPDALNCFKFFASAHVVCARLTLANPDECICAPGMSKAESYGALSVRFQRTAQRLAASLDARNRNEFYSQMLSRYQAEYTG